MKQTAVEWLQSKLKNVEYNPLEKNGYSIAEERLFNQAKEMENQQQDEFAIEFLDSIKEYERENGSRICFDERDSKELLDIY